MVLDEDILHHSNLQYLLCFGRQNDSIKSLIFTENAISLDSDESVDVVH